MHPFLKAWRTFRPSKDSLLLPVDRGIISKAHCAPRLNWKRYCAQKNFGTSDPKLHLSLIPQPFAGLLEKAAVVILMLNPGLGPVDYFGEFAVQEYRKALLKTLRGRFDKRFPNHFLNPRFSWHGGFKFWHGKLSSLIDRFTEQQEISRLDALSYFSQSVASLELIPYHSKRSPKGVRNLASVQLARSYLNEVLPPKAKRGEILIVVTRKAKEWGIKEGRNVVVYSSGQARGAHLSNNTPGGKAILKMLNLRWKRGRD